MSTLKETSCDNLEVLFVLLQNECSNSGERHDRLLYRLDNTIFAFYISGKLIGVVVKVF
jgi:hypothetical protein